jgi:hypothetical protein
MCRHITREQRIEGWRAIAQLLSHLWSRLFGRRPARALARRA